MTSSKLVEVHGRIQPYQWGGYNYIPDLLSLPADPTRPAAEYWLGAHPSAPSTLAGGEALGTYLERQRAGQLEFLFKVLDVRDMLSIQVHPTLEQAQAGFARENAAGVALDAKHRNYKDECDKPELMVALCEFWLLHGFQSVDLTLAALAKKPFLAPLQTRLAQEGLAAAFDFALAHDHPEVVSMHAQLADFSLGQTPTDKADIDFWVHRWLSANPQTPNGILTLYFFNLVRLQPGQAIYQPPGLPHAYLEGQNIELMANSDNVLRAGLTPKHIDVPELMNICRFEPSEPAEYIIAANLDETGQRRFPTPFEAFELSEIDRHEAASLHWSTSTPELLFCLRGEAVVGDGQSLSKRLVKGQALLVLPGLECHLQTRPGHTTLYRARNRR